MLLYSDKINKRRKKEMKKKKNNNSWALLQAQANLFEVYNLKFQE